MHTYGHVCADASLKQGLSIKPTDYVDRAKVACQLALGSPMSMLPTAGVIYRLASMHTHYFHGFWESTFQPCTWQQAL